MKARSSGTTRDLGRDHQRGQEQQEQQVAAGKAQPRERVAGHGAEQDARARWRRRLRSRCSGPRCSDRVLEHLGVVGEGHLARQPLDLAWSSPASDGLSEVLTIQTNGAPQASASAMPPSQSGQRRARRGWCRRMRALSHATRSRRTSRCRTVSDEDQREQQHRDGRGVAQPVLHDRGLVDVVDDRLRGAGRAAVGHDVDLAEDAQGRDQLQGHDHADRRAADAAGSRARTGAAGSAPSMAAASCSSRGTSCSAARKMHEGEAEIPPDRGDRDADQRPVARGQPGHGGDAEHGRDSWLTSPNWVSSSQTQTRPITVAETTLGVKNSVRARRRRAASAG